MNKHVTHNITKTKKLVNKILVAISGGQDSIYLIKIMEDYKYDYGITKNKKIIISYIYIDHQWRPDSYKQIKHIANYIKCLENNFYIYQFKESIVSEKICRIYRYHLIIKHANQNSYKHIITGHSKTDKTETFLHNFLRGRGVEGMTSLVAQIQVKDQIQLSRPLINISRDNIYWICKKFNLPIWSDTTNYTYSLSRNRIRYELIPYLKKYFHESIENNINYLLYSYHNHHEYIKQNTVKLYINNIHKIYIALNYLNFIRQSFIIQFKIIQLFCIHSINIYLTSKMITKIVKGISKKKYRYNLSFKTRNITLHINDQWIYMNICVI